MPKEFSLLNIDKSSLVVSQAGSNVLANYVFDLSPTIRIEKRRVFSLPVLFGDLGGLYEAMSTACALLIGGLAGSMYKVIRVLNLYRGVGVNHDTNTIQANQYS